MNTNENLITKYKLKALGNNITFVTTEPISKKIIATLITHPDSYINIWSSRDNLDTEITIELNYPANLDNFLEVNDIKKVFEKNLLAF